MRLTARLLTGAALALAGTHAAAAQDAPAALTLDAGSLSAVRLPTRAVLEQPALPTELSTTQLTAARTFFAALRAGRWDEAQAGATALAGTPLGDVAQAELALAPGAPVVDGATLAALVTRAPGLPEAPALAALAHSRGADVGIALPAAQALGPYGGWPSHRAMAKATAADPASAALADQLKAFIKTDAPTDAEAALDAAASTLQPETLTEWQARIAWDYFLVGDDASARRMATVARAGSGDWAQQAGWTLALAAFRTHDWAASADAFALVSVNAQENETRAAGLFWAARADAAGGHPERVENRLRAAAALPETFYGLLARDRLALPGTAAPRADVEPALALPNIRAALALNEAGERDLSDQFLRYQAKIGMPAGHPALLRLAGLLKLPATQLWLAKNGPGGAPRDLAARYPAPAWVPDGGWRVEKSLVFAHALQESSFRTDAVSRAGARGLMQVLPGTAQLIMRGRGAPVGDLSAPSFNIECGQSYLEQLRDSDGTGGLLPKVIAAYNAGPGAVARWNDRARDGGDPLLYIESIPYAETRGYVVAVLRNYWMYEAEAGEKSPSLSALAQGMWPRFPGLPGALAMRASGVTGSQTAH